MIVIIPALVFTIFMFCLCIKEDDLRENSIPLSLVFGAIFLICLNFLFFVISATGILDFEERKEYPIQSMINNSELFVLNSDGIGGNYLLNIKVDENSFHEYVIKREGTVIIVTDDESPKLIETETRRRFAKWTIVEELKGVKSKIIIPEKYEIINLN